MNTIFRNNRSIGLIGMSGVGKTHWELKIKRSENWHLYHVLESDKMIEKKLDITLKRHFRKLILTDPKSYKSMSHTQKMAKWMGFPGDEHYKERRDEYLLKEDEATNEILDRMENAQGDVRVIGDFSGSVIHLLPPTISRLQKACGEIIYLESTGVNMDHLIQNFKDDPKPIVWPDRIFQMIPGKTRDESLMECFPHLLEYRRGLYESLATITIHPEDLIGSDTVEEFFMRVWNSRIQREHISPPRESYTPYGLGKER